MSLSFALLRGLKRYAQWLHTGWPAGEVEPLPLSSSEHETSLPGVYVVGDLTGVPLIKFALDSGAGVVQRLVADGVFSADRAGERLDLLILGGGVAGMAAAREAQRLGLRFEVLEASAPFSTLENFPVGKPIFTYPVEMKPRGQLQLEGKTREALLVEAHAQTEGLGLPLVNVRAERLERLRDGVRVWLEGGGSKEAQRVVVAIGRSGNFRQLGVPGEQLDKVSNRLHDPKAFVQQQVLIVGGGDSALEAALALARAGAHVTLSYRGAALIRPKAETVSEAQQLAQGGGPGSLRICLSSTVKRIEQTEVLLEHAKGVEERLPNDAVFVLIGREAPLAFFRRSGIRLAGEQTRASWLSFGLFMLACIFVYNWKAGGALKHYFESHQLFPFNIPLLFQSLGGMLAAEAQNKATLLGTTVISLSEPGFYYSLLYTVLVVVFGVRRIQRRKTPYVTLQTLSLMTLQTLPLFVLPYFLLPYLGNQGFFDSGWARSMADALFPLADYGHGREYWRSFGLILAWPLFIWNVFSSQPMWAWLGISLVQTFVLIPALVYFWGKGAYCGWICSCGALAETLGDAHRQKMPHGSRWNRLNLVGQVILGVALLLLALRLLSWIFPGGRMEGIYYGLLSGWTMAGIQLNYYWLVDVTLAGIVGVGAYFWFSGRVWCRFFCPLAALMHVYARFGRFRIVSDKKKCISCNVCTSVCHQGIDVMAFASRGEPMADPQCVRCSACVQSCPTGVLSFAQVDPSTGKVLSVDTLRASALPPGEWV